MTFQHARLTIAATASLLLGCGKSATTATSNGSGASSGSGSSATVGDPCSPAALGLGSAKRADSYALPTGCQVNDGADVTVVRDETAFALRVTCTAGVGSGIDWTRHALGITARTLSPGGGGYAPFDDGTKVTLVASFRPNCENDPLPMPMQVPVAFLLPAGSERTFGAATCTLARTCP